MYLLSIGADVGVRTNDQLRTYSRLEYGTPDGTWLLVAAGRIPGKPRAIGRPRRSLARWLRRALSPARPAVQDGSVADA